MKKRLCVVLALVMVLMLSACGHRHAADEWQIDGKEHWKICACGEKFAASAHILNGALVCRNCGAEVYVWDDCTDVTVYDENDNIIRCATFDKDGNLMVDYRTFYTLDDDGNILSEKMYEDDILREESYYEDGRLDVLISYYGAGYRVEMQYDENGNLTSSITYDYDGDVVGQEYSEYVMTADGSWYEAKNTSIDVYGAVYVGEFNEQEDQITWIIHDADGNLVRHEVYEYTYDADGHTESRRTYIDDVLVQEMLYTLITFDDGWRSYLSTVIDYHENGTKTVSTYGEQSELVSETRYDADGNVIE